MVNKEQIFRELVKNESIREEYFDRLPQDICMAFIDNEYVNNLLHERDMLIRLIFGEHSDSIEWFLYEWNPDSCREYDVEYQGKRAKIKNIDEYISWMKENEDFK